MLAKIQNNKKSPLNLFLLSVVIIEIGGIIRIQLNNQTIGNLARITGVAILLVSLSRQIVSNRKGKTTFIMGFLLIWNTINILYSIYSSGLNLTRTFGEESYLLTYILPYILIYDIKTLNLKKLFKYSLLFAVLALIVIAFNYQYIIMASNATFIENTVNDGNITLYFAQLPIMWSIPAAIIFMSPNFVKNNNVLIAFTAFLLATAFSMSFGRRGTSLYGLSFLAVGAYLYLTNPNIPKKRKDKFKLALILFIIIGGAFAMSHFSFLIQRGVEDSRSGINDAFYNDMETLDYIFGRGLNGTYYDPLIIFEDFNFRRPGLETGYLNIILHAGLLYLIPYILLCISAVYYGFFKTRNSLTKAFAVYILVNTLMLPIGSYPIFNLRFFILWVGIIACNNKILRNMTNNEIKNYYNLSAR